MIKGIDFHKLGRLVCLNNELYLLSEKNYNKIFENYFRIALNEKTIKLFDKKKINKEHQELCNKVRKIGKLMGEVDEILRDD